MMMKYTNCDLCTRFPEGCRMKTDFSKAIEFNKLINDILKVGLSIGCDYFDSKMINELKASGLL